MSPRRSPLGGRQLPLPISSSRLSALSPPPRRDSHAPAVPRTSRRFGSLKGPRMCARPRHDGGRPCGRHRWRRTRRRTNRTPLFFPAQIEILSPKCWRRAPARHARGRLSGRRRRRRGPRLQQIGGRGRRWWEGSTALATKLEGKNIHLQVSAMQATHSLVTQISVVALH